jgi:hypothetical protein
MPSSRATERSDSPWAPLAASWRRASSLISRVSSARARSLAVRLALCVVVIALVCQVREHRSITRAVLLTFGSTCVHTDLYGEQCSQQT